MLVILEKLDILQTWTFVMFYIDISVTLGTNEIGKVLAVHQVEQGVSCAG